MEPNKILSANILDLIFDDRNKEYGAYDLRVTYPERIKKSLLFVFLIIAVAITGAALASSLKPHSDERFIAKEVTITEIDPDKKEVIPPPEVKKPDPPQTKTVQFTTPVITEENPDPPPTQDEIAEAIVDIKTQDGLVDERLAEPKDIDKGTGIIETNKNTEPEGPFRRVEVEAKFTGDWGKFLTRNLNANLPVDNGAPAGQYKVIIEFVVDKEGNVSDIKPLTNLGYGMEQEAIRVLKKATKWLPAIQNGYPVKAYRTQPITFVVEEQ
jgi:periplasmic protein TonB